MQKISKNLNFFLSNWKACIFLKKLINAKKTKANKLLTLFRINFLNKPKLTFTSFIV